MSIAIKGRARIIVSDDLTQLAEVKIQKPLAGNVYWDSLEVKDMFDTWQSFLLLPEQYTIVGTFFSIAYHEWTIVVESDTLPLPREGETLPILNPMYKRTADGKISLIIDSLKLKE